VFTSYFRCSLKCLLPVCLLLKFPIVLTSYFRCSLKCLLPVCLLLKFPIVFTSWLSTSAVPLNVYFQTVFFRCSLWCLLHVVVLLLLLLSSSLCLLLFCFFVLFQNIKVSIQKVYHGVLADADQTFSLGIDKAALSPLIIASLTTAYYRERAESPN